jgi:SAM-dependent methyltransferase
MSGHDLDTLDFYQREAPTYVSSRPDGLARHLPGFLSRLKPGASILELGCGGGVDAAAMIAQGFDVEPTDGTPAIAAQAQALLSRPVQVMKYDELEAVSRFDAVIATAALLHVPRTGLIDILKRVHRALRPGGWHVASFKAGGTEGRDELGRYYNYPNHSDLEYWYASAGPWDMTEIDAYEGGGYVGKRGPWLAITVRKPV